MTGARGALGAVARLLGRRGGRAPAAATGAAAPATGLAWPPGHFYSPIPDLAEVVRARARIFDGASPLLGIDLNEAGQLDLFDRLRAHYDPAGFPERPTPGRRYHFDNDNFRHGEALILAAILGHLRPRRVVEVGSGFSSAATLDVRDATGAAFACTFVEPYPALLRSLLRPSDEGRVEIIASPVQEVPLEVFEALGAGDCLVIDSTHVLKTGSDVAHHLFEILPRLASGVWVHFHDVHYPFEYPEAWVMQGRAWNEAYALRAFLQYNAAFEIAFFNAWFAQAHAATLAAGMPLAARGPGSSLWLRRR